MLDRASYEDYVAQGLALWGQTVELIHPGDDEPRTITGQHAARALADGFRWPVVADEPVESFEAEAFAEASETVSLPSFEEMGIGDPGPKRSRKAATVGHERPVREGAE